MTVMVIDNNQFGNSPLHVACEQGNVSAFRSLVQLGADERLTNMVRCLLCSVSICIADVVA